MPMIDPAHAPKVWGGWSDSHKTAMDRADREVENLLSEYGWHQLERISQLLNIHVQDHFHAKEDK